MSQDTDTEFHPNGGLTYAINAGDRWQIIRLTYRVDGDCIISDQPSSPREERTRFYFKADGTLVLENGGMISHFRRGVRRYPDF
jgi:hypothetical protein